MDDFGSNLADETTEMVPESAVNPTTDLRKRRSTRIVQAVPLQVTGVDALGRPFVERTSSLILNCHGCRYQSKHYVLKNMWVALEVPHPETGQPPRTVRGRVAWIQRPRTVRQLFQLALALENPGNTWGMRVRPGDRFAFPHGAHATAEAAAALHLPEHAKHVSEAAEQHQESLAHSANEADFNLPLSEEAAPENHAERLRSFPAPA